MRIIEVKFYHETPPNTRKRWKHKVCIRNRAAGKRKWPFWGLTTPPTAITTHTLTHTNKVPSEHLQHKFWACSLTNKLLPQPLLSHLILIHHPWIYAWLLHITETFAGICFGLILFSPRPAAHTLSKQERSRHRKPGAHHLKCSRWCIVMQQQLSRRCRVVQCRQDLQCCILNALKSAQQMKHKLCCLSISVCYKECCAALKSWILFIRNQSGIWRKNAEKMQYSHFLQLWNSWFCMFKITQLQPIYTRCVCVPTQKLVPRIKSKVNLSYKS